jgi:signal peptidase II
MIRSAVHPRHFGLVVTSVALIFAGALGNIIDSTFYGVLFSASTPFQTGGVPAA